MHLNNSILNIAASVSLPLYEGFWPKERKLAGYPSSITISAGSHFKDCPTGTLAVFEGVARFSRGWMTGS